uniref:Advillin-like n=1 Tax=Hirondellea gigas TaxID=1518452 RepID=A0A2P2I1V0_9CRUS
MPIKGMGDSGGRFQRDQAFNNIPNNSTAFLIWRVQNLGLVPVPTADYGKFHKGDSYVIYSAAEYGTSGGVNEKWHNPRGSMEINIHFWVGSETSTDEAAVAAIKSVELDMCLAGAPVQHRETEGHESKKFKGYFKNGIRVLQGGVGSGLKHVSDVFKPSLYHIKGKRSVLIKELPSVSWDHMNDGDVFVLETRDIVYVWVGRYSNNIEKLRGAKFASTLKAERGSRGSVVILEDGQESSLQGLERESFEEVLPLTSKIVVSHTQMPKDEVVARKLSSELRLYRCSDEAGTLKVTEIKTGPLSQKDLNSKDAFIIDNGADGIWVWIGKKASSKERQEAMRNALGFVAKKGYSKNTNTTRVIDGGEPPSFQALFRDWRVPYQSRGFGKQASLSHIAHPVQQDFKAETLHEQPHRAASSQMVDDGTGQKEIWRIHDFELEPVADARHGEFFMGDCYLILYAYSANRKENYIIYHWQGVDSTQDEQGTAAAKAVELDQKLQGRASIVRVVQGKEPPHFMAIFKGTMVTYEGGYGSGFKSLNERDVASKDNYMLQVRGSSPFNTKATEVDFRAGSLNSNDCFVVVSPHETFLWCGKGCTGDEREMAKALIKQRADPLMVMEGREPESFWKALGGKEAYASDKIMADENYNGNPPRLFQCSNATGVFTAEEILHFSQEDLIEDDVMLLDTWTAVFIWLGTHCNKVERVNSQALAFEYLKTDPSGRSVDTPVILIKQGYEPPNFTGFFGVWDNDLWNNNMTYADISERLQESSPGCTVLVTPSSGTGTDGGKNRRTYPINILRIKDGDNLPDDIDPTHKEEHMTDGDFEREFKMNRDKFAELPEWKKQNMKKKAGIY